MAPKSWPCWVRGVVEVKDRGNKIWYTNGHDVQRSPPESRYGIVKATDFISIIYNNNENRN